MLMSKHERGHASLDDHKNYHYTNDVDIASMLVCKGYSLEDIFPLSKTKFTFVFKNHPAIADAVDGFWNNRIEVRPLEFSNARKNLKSRIFALQRP